MRTFKKSFLKNLAAIGFGWVFLFVICIPCMARGEGNLHVGTLEIHPYISSKETYNSNIYATANKEEYDYITIITPGISLQLPFRLHQILLDYNTVFTRHAKYTAENTTDHNASSLLDFKLGSLINLKLTDTYTKNHEQRGFSSTGFIERYETNAATFSAIYQMEDISKVQIDYTKTTWNFKTSKFRERDEDLLAGYIYYKFLPKTSAFLEYDHKYIDYNLISKDFNNDVDIALFGIDWKMTEKSNGIIKGGYLWKNYAMSSKEDYQTWTASIDLNYEFSDDTSVKIVGKRTISEPKIQGNRYLISTGAYSEIQHRFIKKLSVSFRGSYSKDIFSEAVLPDITVRKDLTVMTGTGLNYLIRDWLELEIDYYYRDRNSNLNTNDYEENVYTFTINFAL